MSLDAAFFCTRMSSLRALHLASYRSPNLLPRAVQPDRPQLCRFWLAGLASALKTAAVRDAPQLLRCLAAFLWRYTWAAVPEQLRALLIAPLERLCCEATAILSKGMPAGSPKGTAAVLNASHCDMGGRTVTWILRGDAAFLAWGETSQLASPSDIGATLVEDTLSTPVREVRCVTVWLSCTRALRYPDARGYFKICADFHLVLAIFGSRLGRCGFAAHHTWASFRSLTGAPPPLYSQPSRMHHQHKCIRYRMLYCAVFACIGPIPLSQCTLIGPSNRERTAAGPLLPACCTTNVARFGAMTTQTSIPALRGSASALWPAAKASLLRHSVCSAAKTTSTP